MVGLGGGLSLGKLISVLFVLEFGVALCSGNREEGGEERLLGVCWVFCCILIVI